MIDRENEIITAVKTALATDYPNMPVYSITNLSPETFPCVSIEMSDNYVWKKASTTARVENAAKAMFEVNVYSNKANGKKTEAKKIFQIIDSTLSQMYFIREYTRPVSIDNGTVYRLVGRYTGLL